MKKYEIHFNDWLRILCGEVPATFYIELVIRALVVYLILMFSMRAMGKRMSSQLSRNELAALVSLAAAVGVPMMAPNRGLMPAMVIATVVVSLQRIIASRAVANQPFEKFSQGNVSLLISNAVIDMKVLEQVGLSQGELFSQLRGQSVTHLGHIERLYMEANGSFTLVKSEPSAPGLTVLPGKDQKFISELKPSADIRVCCTCGLQQTQQKPAKCSNCAHDSWTAAVTGE